MEVDRPQRKLSAIMAADVVGYSRMMHADEEGTLANLNGHMKQHVGPIIDSHRGRIVKNLGDGFLATFASLVDALRCAVELQSGMAHRNARIVVEKQLIFRIGINVGDVIEQDGDVFGDGVNIASRLEALSEPGGICISERAQEDAKGKVDLDFESIGEQHLKNIGRPIRAFRIRPARAAAAEPLATPLSLLSVAVLPFDNLSGDAEQGYFADGIVEDIITRLSHFKTFAVVARNSSFVYRGRNTDLREIAKELGVRYLLEGSVRRSGDRLRVTVQLIEGENGAHLWAQNFDGQVADVFDVQDRITEMVVSIVEPRIKRAEIERSRRKRPDSLDAYDLYLQALPNVYSMLPSENEHAIHLLNRAVELDPGFALAFATAGLAYLSRIATQLEGAKEGDVEICVGHARSALATGTDDPAILATCGFLLLEIGRQYEEGMALQKRAILENPNDVTTLTFIGISYLMSDDLEVGAGYLERAVRLNPNDVGAHWQLTGLAHIRMAQGRYEEALKWAYRSLGVNSVFDCTYWMLIAGNAYLGRMEDAGRHLAALRIISPKVSLSRIRRGQHAKDPQRIDVLLEGMRLAGMPMESEIQNDL